MGLLTLVTNGHALTQLEFEPSRTATCARGADNVLELARRELGANFAGALRVFAVPVAPQGTPFQRKVWEAL